MGRKERRGGSLKVSTLHFSEPLAFQTNRLYKWAVPTYYGNANYRKKFDAFRIVDESGHEPLKQAIACALQMRESSGYIAKALESDTLKPETKAQLTIALTKCLPDEFHAWIKVAEFVYSKPKHLTVEGHITYEKLLDGTWRDMLPNGNGNGNGNDHEHS